MSGRRIVDWIGKIHTRLQVEETEVIYLKNHEFKYKKKELNTVFLTVSTFVYPHLWLFKHRQELEVVKGVIVESIESIFRKTWCKYLKYSETKRDYGLSSF